MIEYFCFAIELAWPGVFCRDIVFLCRGRVGQGKEELCRDRQYYVATELPRVEKISVMTKDL